MTGNTFGTVCAFITFSCSIMSVIMCILSCKNNIKATKERKEADRLYVETLKLKRGGKE